MKNFSVRAQELRAEMTAIRRRLHENAEGGDDLPQTVALVTETLAGMGLEPREICKGGVCALIEGGREGKTILLRADMDALPMAEASGLSFSSKTNFAHTCGHDLHTSMLLGAARMLVEARDQMRGRVKLMFQPAEESLLGAEAMIKAGILEDPVVDAAVDLHVMADIPFGRITCADGAVFASCDGFRIAIHGKGCHGAQPDTGIDPINVGAHLHLALQALISRETPPREAAVLTIGKFAAGTAPNIIPETAVMEGTLRTFNQALRARLFGRVPDMVKNTAQTFGATADVDVISGVPPLMVDAGMMRECLTYLQNIDEAITFDPEHRFSGSDDFARIAEKVPSVFFALGSDNESAAEHYSQHSPKAIFNEGLLPWGAAVFAQCAFNWLSAR